MDNIQNSIVAAAPHVQYTAKTHTTGGRDGMSRSSDGILEVKLATPGTKTIGTNPEQLFAAGWSACFEGAMGVAARRIKLRLPADLAIDAEVDLCNDDGEFTLQARLNITLPGLDPEIGRQIVKEAQTICPYSKAVHGNIKVEYNLV